MWRQPRVNGPIFLGLVFGVVRQPERLGDQHPCATQLWEDGTAVEHLVYHEYHIGPSDIARGS